MKGLLCDWTDWLTGRLKMGMGASDLGLGEGGEEWLMEWVGGPVTSESNWNPQPDWHAGRRDPSYFSSQL